MMTGDTHVTALTAALDERDFFIKAEAAWLLGELGDPRAVDALVGYVNACRHQTKTSGFEALVKIGDPRAAGGVRHLVAHPNMHDDWYWIHGRGVKASAAVCLLAFGDVAGKPFLMELADQGHDVFYALMAPAILRLPDEHAADIKARLSSEAMLEPKNSVRFTEPGRLTILAEALGLVGDERACDYLVGLLSFRSRYTRAQAALSLLATAPTEAHIAAVEKLADGDETDFARVKASLALFGAGRTDRLQAVRQAAKNAEDPFDRASALSALGTAAQPADLRLTTRALVDADSWVRTCAVEALERLGAGAGEVSGMLEDDDARVRLQAHKFLAARHRSASR